jgi:8-amino-3,8-dideoxy-alpha-D-manno-octulosonate transaminase
VLDNGVLMRYGFDGMRNGHWKAKALEKELESTLECDYVQLVSNGTSAVSVALASAGVGSGDEVIMPTFTFVASFEAILLLGAIPILVDIDDTLGLDPKAVEAAITPKTKAVMVVQMCGSMAKMTALSQVCKKHNLLLVEDACQAIGGRYNNKPLGTIGDLGCFSFDFVKTVTCGEGGAVITNNKEYYTNADHFSDHGHDHEGNDRGAETHPFLGYNFRISELHAAVGLAQIKRLPEFLAVQKKNYNTLRDILSNISEVTFRTVPEGGEESYAFLNFFLPDLETARRTIAGFKDSGVDACWNYFDNNWHYVRKWNHLKDAKSLFPLSKDIKDALSVLSEKEFTQSDHYIGRNISCLIKLSWSEEEVKVRAEKMKEAILKAL